jgi:hypothetical protein
VHWRLVAVARRQMRSAPTGYEQARWHRRTPRQECMRKLECHQRAHAVTEEYVGSIQKRKDGVHQIAHKWFDPRVRRFTNPLAASG